MMFVTAFSQASAFFLFPFHPSNPFQPEKFSTTKLFQIKILSDELQLHQAI